MIACYVLAIVYAVVILIPIYYLVISAFKSTPQIVTQPLAPPVSLDLSNFADAERQVKITPALGVSLFVTVGAEIVTLLLAFPAAYAIGRIPSRSSTLVEAIFGLGFLIPTFALLLPVFLMFAFAHLLNNPIDLILFYPATRLPLSVLLLATYVRQVPRDLEEIAFIDGATRVQSMIKIVLPLTRPGLVTVVILNFIDVWNEYLFALVLLSSQNKTAQVAVPLLKSEHAPNYGLLAAGSLITLIPVYLVFVFAQRRISSGLFAGATKG